MVNVIKPLGENVVIVDVGFISTGSSAMADGPRNALVSIEKSLQSMNDLDIHPRSSQLLRLNGRTAYHFVCRLSFQHLYLGRF